MTFANNMDRDQAPQNVGPDLGSILFDNKYQFMLKTFFIRME